MKNNDRTVHAVCEDGREVVRYDRAGKWYVEPVGYPDAPRRAVSLAEAVAIAVETSRGGGRVYFGKPGGGLFDRRVTTACITTALAAS